MESLPDDLLMQCLGRLSRPDDARARCVSRRLHRLLCSEATFDYRSRQGFLEPWLCVLGGIQDEKGELLAEMFDFRANKWRPMPSDLTNSFFNLSCAVIATKLYAVGGFVGLADTASHMCVYNMRTHAWEEAAQMAELREACACGVIEGRIYVAGGLCRNKWYWHRANTAEVYIPEEDHWFPIANMHYARSCCGSSVVGEKLYVIGGYGNDNILQSVEVYDPIEDSWTRKADMPGVWIIAGCAAIGSHIYVLGSNITDIDSQELVMYDTLTNEWQLIDTIPFDQLVVGSKCSLWGCAVATAQGKLFVIGGASSYDGGGLNTFLVYDPDNSSWTRLREMKSRRHGCAATIIYC